MQKALNILNQTFGYPEFRDNQGAAVDALIAGEDVLVLMPTGGGKSLCYQIPAMVRPGTGIVVSPLIALMQDQVDALHQLGINAAYLNSSMHPEEQRQVEQQLLAGELDLIYIAPERLIQPRMIDLMARMEIALFAIDEAHCVSQWGHDFRSDYLALSLLHEDFPNVPRIALTATADDRTRGEIISRLQLEDARHFVSGFDRPNIQYRITQKDNPRQQLLRFLKQEHSGDAGIVYCLSRKKTEATAEFLCGHDITALPYHAGLSAEIRQRNQQRFLREEGIVIVATIAFGMGIDKPDVRFVAHMDLPKSVEAYYQETGRAGRDGAPATAWMAYGIEDVIKLKQMMSGSEGSEEFKRAEHHKLDAMLGLCEVTSCRRQVLLAYFGEIREQPCGNCDSCLSPAEIWDGTDAARKALSCIYRTGQRFGVTHLIDVLRGAENAKIEQFNHSVLSTYGIGSDLDIGQWRSVYRQLVARGYIAVDVDGYGALKLTDKSRALLRGEETISLRREVKATRQRKPRKTSAGVTPSDNALWDALRECRKQLADEFGVPPYVIFHDATLMQMMEYRPQNPQQMLDISGVGASKLEKFGEAFLQVIAAAD